MRDIFCILTAGLCLPGGRNRRAMGLILVYERRGVSCAARSSAEIGISRFAVKRRSPESASAQSSPRKTRNRTARRISPTDPPCIDASGSSPRRGSPYNPGAVQTQIRHHTAVLLSFHSFMHISANCPPPRSTTPRGRPPEPARRSAGYTLCTATGNEVISPAAELHLVPANEAYIECIASPWLPLTCH